MNLSKILLLLKGKRGVVGEIRTWANGKRYKKTTEKWIEVNEHGQPKEKKAKAEPKKKKEAPVKKPAAKKKFSDSEIKVKAEKIKKKLKEAKKKPEKQKATKEETPKEQPAQNEAPREESTSDNSLDYKTNGVKAKAFKSWFGDWEQAKQTGDYSNVSKVLNEKKEPQEMSSVMVDDNGDPLKMLHGTTADFFTEFDKNKARGGRYGAGFYFTENKEKANAYRYRDENANSAFNTLDEMQSEAYSLDRKLSGKQLNGVRDPFKKIKNYILDIKGKYGKSDLVDIFQAEGELKNEIIKIHSMLNDRIKEMNSHKVLKKEHGEIKINPDVDKLVIDVTNPKSQDKREDGLKTIYLDIKKPFYIDFTSDKLSHEINIANLEKLGDKQLLEAYKSTSWDGGIQSYAYAGRYKDEPKRGETKEQREKRKKENDDAFLIFSNLLKSKGFDGTIMASFKENGDIDRKKIFENNEVHKHKKHFNYEEVVAFDPNQIKSVDNSGDFNPKENNMYKSFLILLKGKRAAVGEIRNWKGGNYIKTPTGWKPHEKQYSKKYTERKNNASVKKDSDKTHRMKEVARLSGEIEGHKAAVEHHTAQGSKDDVRQAKHHSIRSQVKQRRLDKHKQILEQRHGVKDEPSNSLSDSMRGNDNAKKDEQPRSEQYNKVYNSTKEEYKNKYTDELIELKEARERLESQGILGNNDIDNASKQAVLNLIKENPNNFNPERIKRKEAEEKLKQDFSEFWEYGNSEKDGDYLPNAINANKLMWEYQKKYKDSPLLTDKANQRKFIESKTGKKQETNKVDNVKINGSELKEEILPEKVKQDILTAKLKFESWKADRQAKSDTPKEEANVKKETSDSWLNDAYKQDLIFGKIPESMSLADKTKLWNISTKVSNLDMQLSKLRKQSKPKNLKTSEKVKVWQKAQNQRIKELEAKKSPLIKEGRALKNPVQETTPEPTKSDVIQSGNRGATIAGQQFSKREVDILNSLDDIVRRVKSPKVQELINKRTTPKEEPKTDLQPHESKFMELVKRNRSQADKQAGYPDERRKVERETGVKIPREKAVEMTKHMKASFIWDIKKALTY